MPFNQLGGRANPNNEAHISTIAQKGIAILGKECETLVSIPARRALIQRALPLIEARGIAHAAAIKGEFEWKNRLLARGKVIGDFWDGDNIIWPDEEILNMMNTSSVSSFVYYLSHDVTNGSIHPNIAKAIKEAEENALNDPFWIVDSLDQVVM